MFLHLRMRSDGVARRTFQQGLLGADHPPNKGEPLRTEDLPFFQFYSTKAGLNHDRGLMNE